MSGEAIPAVRLSAILAADAAGYSRLMTIDDRLTVELLDAGRAVFRDACAEHDGRIVDMAGDSVLLAFGSAASALRCALAVQQRLVAQANPENGTLRLPFRIGVHLGDVIEKADGSVYGDGVNIAARLQALAEPDEVFVSQAIRDTLGARPVARFEDMGAHQLKNVANPVRAWRALSPNSDATSERPATTSPSAESLRFDGRYEVQPMERRLLVDGRPVAIGARAFNLLLALVEHPGTLLGKNELLDRVWPGQIVDDDNLVAQIGALRDVFGGDVISTIPGRGYRFSARIDTEAPASASAASRTSPASAGLLTPPTLPTKLQTNLPVTLPQLVGRAEDMAALGQLIGQHRLVSIVGAGGMGKTTIALHLTANRQAEYRHGVCWVELANVTEADTLPSAMAAAMGVDIGSGNGRGHRQRRCVEGPVRCPRTADHAADAGQRRTGGRRRGDGHPGGSRQGAGRAFRGHDAGAVEAGRRAGLPHRFPHRAARPAAGLASDGVRRSGVVHRTRPGGRRPFYVDRRERPCCHRSMSPARRPGAGHRTRRRACPMLGVQRLASSMGDRLKVLTSSRNRIAPARQQTLRAALEWSHGFLEARERAVFRRLSVFAGSASLTQVQQVVPDAPEASPVEGGDPLDEWAVLDGLALLVDRSLVVALTPDDAAEPRYRLLDTSRLFAREKLQEAGEDEALRQRHGHVVAGLFDTAWVELYTGTIGFDAWRQLTIADLDNGREALAWALAAGDVVSVAQIATTLSVALPRSAHREILALADALEPLIERIDGADLLARVGRLFQASLSNTQRQRAVVLIRRCVACMPPVSADETPQDRWAHTLAMTSLAMAEMNVDKTAAATALAQPGPGLGRLRMAPNSRLSAGRSGGPFGPHPGRRGSDAAIRAPPTRHRASLRAVRRP